MFFSGLKLSDPTQLQRFPLRWPLPEPRYRLLYICFRPIPHVSPLFRRLTQDPRLDVHVVYCTLGGTEAIYDSEFDTSIQARLSR
jgi:hypothetical protein